MNSKEFRKQVREQITKYRKLSKVLDASHRLMGISAEEDALIRLYITQHFIIDKQLFDDFSLKHDAIIQTEIANFQHIEEDDINSET